MIGALLSVLGGSDAPVARPTEGFVTKASKPFFEALCRAVAYGLLEQVGCWLRNFFLKLARLLSGPAQLYTVDAARIVIESQSLTENRP